MYNNVIKIVKIYTNDLDFINHNSSDVYPYAVWVDRYQVENSKQIRDYLLGYSVEYGLLMDGKIDYILIEYDM